MESPYIEKHGRFWAVYDGAGLLVCVAVYRKGADEIIRRLLPPTTEGSLILPVSPHRRMAASTESYQLSERNQNYG